MSALDDSKIKEQHELIKLMISDITSAACNGHDRGKVMRMMALFVKRLRVYCDNEEQVMMMKGYKYLPSHRDDHSRLYETLGLIVRVCADTDIAINNEIGSNIEAIISEHDRVHDSQMLAYLEKVG